MSNTGDPNISRRNLLIVAGASVAAGAAPGSARAQQPLPVGPVASGPVTTKVGMIINGASRSMELDTRTTLLDALREHMHLTGTKKAATTASVGLAQ
jgi:xanthine dehydrogenase YagT iron-sulfur-binding subunit